MSASANSKELTLSEMRVLVSSVVHLNVEQIALCAMTIPKLQHAILDLLGTSPMAALSPLCRGKPDYDVSSATNGPSESGVRAVPQPQNGTVCSTESMSNDEMDTSIASNQSDSIVHITPAGSVNADTRQQEQQQQQQQRQQLNVLPDLPMLQPAGRIKPTQEASPNVGTEITMVGDKIAIGRPGKSKAKTDKRVRYITCRVCHLLFYKRDQYREHMRTHANDPNITIYSCDQCTFVTKRRGVFQTHFLRHTGDLPYKCEMCDYAGRQPSLLKQHMVNKHSDCYKADDSDPNKSEIIAQRVKEELDPSLFGLTEIVLPQASL